MKYRLIPFLILSLWLTAWTGQVMKPQAILPPALSSPTPTGQPPAVAVTPGGSAAAIGQAQWRTYTVDDGLAENLVRAIAVNQDGHIWTGGRSKVSEYDGQTWWTYTEADGLPRQEDGELAAIHALAVDPAGHIWVGTGSGGVGEYDGQKWTTYTTADGLANNLVSDIVIDAQGDKWFATYGGVSKFDGQSWTTYSWGNGLAGELVNDLAIDQAGHVWAGTETGVSRFDGQSWTTYTQANGLATDQVNAVAVAPNGHIWVSALYGLSSNSRYGKIEKRRFRRGKERGI